MNLREIKYFLMVAECLSYSAAAAKLYISQPSLSKVISQMEEDLGFKLFRRSTRKVELTEEGRGFYAISKAYMEQCDRLIQGELPAETIRGKLSIAFEVTMDTLYMPFIVAAFQQKYPNISVTVSKQKTEVLIQHLRNQKVNLGLMSSFAVPSMGFQKQLLFPYQLQILVWKGHAFCGEKSVKLKDLAHETFVILDPSVSRSSKTVLQLFSAIGLPLKESIYAANYRQMFLLTAKKEGISFNLTMSNAAEYWDLVSVDVDLSDCPNSDIEVGMAWVWRKGYQTLPVKLFLDTVETLQISMPTTTRLSDD